MVHRRVITISSFWGESSRPFELASEREVRLPDDAPRVAQPELVRLIVRNIDAPQHGRACPEARLTAKSGDNGRKMRSFAGYAETPVGVQRRVMARQPAKSP
jgi:hypothetical protein